MGDSPIDETVVQPEVFNEICQLCGCPEIVAITGGWVAPDLRRLLGALRAKEGKETSNG